jgi:predicted small integral membrane protein
LTETYTSAIHGISISYPAGWRVRAATEPWTTGIVQQESAFGDVIYESETDSPFIAMASQALVGKTAEQWSADYVSVMEDCGPTEPVTVDGASGVIGVNCFLALVVVEDRGYLIWLYRVDDIDWFREILATVRLHPEGAQAAPSPSSSSNPSPS